MVVGRNRTCPICISDITPCYYLTCGNCDHLICHHCFNRKRTIRNWNNRFIMTAGKCPQCNMWCDYVDDGGGFLQLRPPVFGFYRTKKKTVEDQCTMSKNSMISVFKCVQAICKSYSSGTLWFPMDAIFMLRHRFMIMHGTNGKSIKVLLLGNSKIKCYLMLSDCNYE